MRLRQCNSGASGLLCLDVTGNVWLSESRPKVGMEREHLGDFQRERLEVEHFGQTRELQSFDNFDGMVHDGFNRGYDAETLDLSLIQF